MSPRPALALSALLSLAQAACGPAGPADVAQLELPGAAYYPESVSAASDGTLYVGSVGTGQVVRFAPGATAAEVLVPPSPGTAVAGVLVDESGGALYYCANDQAGKAPPTLRSVGLRDGAARGAWPFPAPGFCNDLAFDGARRLYVTDSGGKIYRLLPSAAALAPFSADPALAPSSPQGFGADGVVWDGEGALLVNTFSDPALLRIPIGADGSAGPAARIAVSPALGSPDAMRLLGPGRLLVVEGAGRLSEVTLSGAAATARVLADGLDSPTSVATYGRQAWVSEGQLGHFLGLVSGPPKTPFVLRRVALP